MSNKKDFKKWFTLIVLILGGGTIYKLSSLKDAFYIPMQQYFHLTHTQIGIGLSVYGIIQTFGYIFSIYLSDRFSKKVMLPFSLICIGLTGFYLATFPGYQGFLVAFGVLAVFGEVTYWPVLLKTVRLLGNDDEQGRMFGFLEAGRGIVDTIVAFSALGIFSLLGSEGKGFRAAIIFFSIVPIIVGVISYFLLEDDKIREVDENGKKIGKNSAAFSGMLTAIKMPEIWVAAFTVFSVYCVYCGLTYFIPFLNEIYGMPVAFVGAYGIINQYGLKMVGGPIGGFLVDKKVKSAAKYLRGAFVVAAVAMAIFVMLPHESMNVYVGMTLTLSFGAIIFTMRAVFFVPMEEIKVPRELTGAAMSIGSLIGYAPSMFAFTLYGSMLDKTPGIQGYRHVFMTMIGFAVMGILVSSVLIKIIKKKNQLESKIVDAKY
jgi:predicted MFS family arabinose efflux permease